MTIDLLCFGILKDLVGGERDQIELQDDATVADLLGLMQLRRVATAAIWSSLAVAVNREYAVLTTILHDGDEVALLPPVSGGAHVPAR